MTITAEQIPRKALDSCSTCGAPIVWATVDMTGKPMPVDRTPVTGGTLDLYKVDGGKVACHIIKPAHLAFGRKNLRRSHFETCKQAGDHRKPRGRSNAQRH